VLKIHKNNIFNFHIIMTLNILQFYKNMPPKFMVEYNLKNISDCNFNCWKDTDFFKWSEFIKNNPCDKFKDIQNLIDTTDLYFFRKYFFIFYYLYVEGGLFINDDIVIEQSFKQLDLSNKTIIVESALNNEEAFIECIYSHKKNRFIEILLNKLIMKYKENILKTDVEIISFIKNTIITFVKMTNELLSENDFDIKKIIICKELIEDNVSKIYDDNINNLYFKHYFNASVKIFTLPEYPNKIIKNVNKNDFNSIKIGVTLNLVNNINDMFCNGINQNSFYLAELLINIGYDVTFYLDTGRFNTETENILKELLYDERFKYKTFSSILNDDLDILIKLSFTFWSDYKLIKYLKYMNVKLVGYFCGNTYIITSEKILYNQHKQRDNTRDCFKFTLDDGRPIIDEIWSIPQMANTNLHYWKTMYRTNCVEVPFIWSTKSFYFTMKQFKLTNETQMLYINRGENKNLGIFEPNISIMKWCLPSVIICENAYRQNKKINHLYITNIPQNNVSNGINDFNIESFNNTISSLDIFSNKICSIETRFNTINFMMNYCDIAVSHQWENPLNYLYFDLAWMGWPVVHNAHLCKDIGYFYDQFDYDEGGKVLSNVIDNHDMNVGEYISKNREAINRYLPTCINLQREYTNLINNVLDKY
jgi:hypothetical protein